MAVGRIDKRPSVLRRVATWASIGGLLTGCTVIPRPIDPVAHGAQLQEQLKSVIASEAAITGPIGLYEAMARAVKYNLDYKIEMMDELLRARQLELKSHDQLPQLVATGNQSLRNNQPGGRSRSLVTGLESQESSTSSDKNARTADLSLSWDVLDFGLSYVRAQQGANESLISLERRRKVINRIIEDVRTAYWRAVSADRTLGQLGRVNAMAIEALRDSQKLEDRKVVAPLQALNFQRDLLQIQADVAKLQRELVLAKRQLAALMNIAPDQDFQLEIPDRTESVPELPGSVGEMVTLAFQLRPELREGAYRMRINDQELQAALIQNLPSLRGVLGINHDSNALLDHQNWLTASTRTSWNLLNVFRYPAVRRTLQAQGDVLQQRQLALAMAVLTQVSVARVRFTQVGRELALARRQQMVHERILSMTRAGHTASTISRQQLVREEMAAVLSEIKFDLAYADMQNAYANLYASIGIDTFGPDITGREDLPTLSRSLEQLWRARASDQL